MTRPESWLLAALTMAMIWPAHADERYDVSYIWHSDPLAVVSYRERVARVLGSNVAKSLKVVRNGELTGLVYLRGGDRAGAVRVAQAHTRLLRPRGLEPAAAALSRNWESVQLAASKPVVPEVVITIRSRLAAAPPQIPKPVPAAIDTSTAEAVEQAVERHVKRLRAERRIAPDERTAWSVYDFTSGQKLVTINEDRPLQAASLIKPFVAAAFLSEVQRGKLRYGPKSRRRLERMIQVSDNGATNWALRKLGGPRRVERLLRSRYPGIFQNTRLVEYIPRDGRTYRNRASARDYSRFLYALWNDRFARSRELKRLMALPGPDRMKQRASQVPDDARVFNKTGSTARLCGDMGILLVTDARGRQIPYTFIGIIQKERRAPNYGAWLRARSRVIGEVSDIVFSAISKRYRVEVAAREG